MDVTRATGPSKPAGAKAGSSVQLRAGSTVVARVTDPGSAGKPGQITLAGGLLRAKLPKGLRRGQKLALQVRGMEGDAVVLQRVRSGRGKKGRAVPARLVAALATKGDGELLRAAVSLSGGPVQLPGRRVAEVEEEADGDQSATGAVRFTLHAPGLGALEVVLRLDRGLLDASVVAEPGMALAAVRSEAAALGARLEAAVNARARVSVVERRGAPPTRPDTPDELEEFELYA
jgi:hypothetical protein